jgi:hypothetical protein
MRRRRYRITAPVKGFPDDSLSHLPGRIALGGSAYLVRLDEAETERLGSANLPDHERDWVRIGHRIEILDVPVRESYSAWGLLEAQMLLVVRKPLPIVAVVLDRKVDGVWKRGGTLDIDEHNGWMNDYPSARFETLRRLRDGMGSIVDETVLRSMELYVQSIYSYWRAEFDNSYMLAAVSFETLLGGSLTTAVSYRLALRAAILEGGGDGGVFDRIKALYDLRSKLVHSGKSVSFTSLVHMHQVLMRLIPTMGALTNEAGSYNEAIEHLDRLARSRFVDPLLAVSGAGWWSYVNLGECFARSYERYDGAARERHIFLHD